VLTVAGPDGSLERRDVAAGTSPAFSLYDAQGFPRPDGLYRWELALAPEDPGSPGRVLAGSFQILDGGFVLPGEAERPASPPRGGLQSSAAKDQMVPDDLVVDGKGCIGLGCANGEGFGPEALRLKQSVVRLRFIDTSGQAGFPTHDWQLTANDAGSGGADKLSIEDLTAGTTPMTILGDAPSNSLYVDASGRVGLGTAFPTQELTLKSKVDGQNVMEIISADDDQVIMRVFETMDGAGLISLFDAAGNEDFRMTGSGGLSFFSGRMGLNCSSAGSPPFDLTIKTGTNSDTACDTGTRSQISAGQTQFTVASSRTIKENLRPIQVPGILERIAAVDVYSYDFIDGPKDSLGLMAEDFHSVFGRGSDKLINGQEVEMALWLAVQELTAENKGQKQMLEEQRNLIRRLEERLARLEENK
jgi:hypothetical protein